MLSDLFRMVVKMIVGGLLIILLVSCGVTVVAGAGAAAGGKKIEKAPKSEFLYGNKDSDNAIMRVNIIGPILSHKRDDDNGFFSQMQNFTYGYEVKEELLKAAKDDKIKAVMIFVTTPGGSIVGSEAIHDGVLAVREAGKPVVAYIDSFSASGGVWSTAGADKIFADNGSLIGSVGVNFGNWFYYDDPVAIDGGIFSGGVTTRGGVKASFLGAGKGKDLGNPWRPMAERERDLLQSSAEYYYNMFVDHVVENRGIDRQALVDDYGAMIFADALAQERGYIDGVKTYQESLSYIAAEIGAEGDDWKLVSPPEVKKTPLEKLMGAYLRTIGGEEALRAQEKTVCAELLSRPVAMSVKSLTDLCGA